MLKRGIGMGWDGMDQDDMNCAEDYVRFMCQWLLDHCLEDMKFISSMYDKTAVDRLKLVASTPFVRITYTEAIEILEKARTSKCGVSLNGCGCRRGCSSIVGND